MIDTNEQTNIDVIRNAPKDVLAKFLNSRAKCSFCVQKQNTCDCNCTQNTMLWLSRPLETEENERKL